MIFIQWNTFEKRHAHCINPLRQGEAYASVNLAIICLDNGILPDWHQAISNQCRYIVHLTHGISVQYESFSYKKINAKISSAKWQPFCLGLSVHIFSCDQAALQMVFSVRPSIRPSVRPSVRLSIKPFSPCSHHRIIMKFSGVITMVKSDVHAKGQGQRSKVKVTEVNTQLSRFRTLTPVWIHIWQWNDAYSLMMLRRGALLFLKVIRQISRSHGSKKRRIWPRLGVSGL